MKFDPHKHHRRSIRLKGYDYTQAGGYFVTICVKYGQCVLGEIKENQMWLNNWGRIIDMEWSLIPDVHGNLALDVYQIMPNHFHGLFWILDKSEGVGARRVLPLPGDKSQPPSLPLPPSRNVSKFQPGDAPKAQFGKPQKGSVATIVGSFKSAVTKAINDLEDTRGAPFWQRGYYDQIIKNEEHLTAVRQYILNNPANWEADILHPNAPPNKFNQSWSKPK